MDSFGFPQGLIRYDSEQNLAAPEPTAPRVEWKRLKTIGYGAALILMSAYLAYSIGTRGSYDRAVNQIRQPLYVVLSNGDIRNRYQVRITNKAAQDQTYEISASGIPAGALDLGNFREITIKPGHSGLVQASVRLTPELAEHTHHFELIITPKGKPAEARSETFDLTARKKNMINTVITLFGGLAAVLVLYALGGLIRSVPPILRAVLAGGIPLVAYFVLIVGHWPGLDVVAIHISVFFATALVLFALTLFRRRGGRMHWAPKLLMFFFAGLTVLMGGFLYIANKGLPEPIGRWWLGSNGGPVYSGFSGVVPHNQEAATAIRLSCPRRTRGRTGLGY